MRRLTNRENIAYIANAVASANKKQYIPSTSKAKLKSGYQVVKIDPITQEVTSLTFPGHLRSTKNSKRKLESIGVENLFLIHSEWFKKPRKK